MSHEATEEQDGTGGMEFLRRRREQLGLSQGQAANLMQVSRATWNRWEQGRNLPRVGQTLLLAEVLEWPVETLAPKLAYARRLQQLRWTQAAIRAGRQPLPVSRKR